MAGIPAPELFWSQVNRDSGTFCWLWIGRTDPAGYGLFGKRRAHRIAWEWRHGLIPAGKIIRHNCDNPPCVNPDHLALGTHYDNAVDRQIRRRVMDKVLRHGWNSDVVLTQGARNWESSGSLKMRGIDRQKESQLHVCWKCGKAFFREDDGTLSGALVGPLLEEPQSCPYCPK